MRTTTTILAAALAVASFGAQAADPAEQIVLQVQQGQVMTSTGGEFANAASGQPVIAGERVMLADGATASVVYANGCAYEYTTPGVHPVRATCTGGGAGQSGSTVDGSGTGMEVAVIVGAAVLAAAALDQMEDTRPPPISR